MKTHELKTWPCFFQPMKLGNKAFEVRRDDRGYAIGDVLVLREWEPDSETYTGDSLTVKVTYILTGMGLQEGFVALGVSRVEPATRSADALPPCPKCGKRSPLELSQAALSYWDHGACGRELWGGYAVRCECGVKLLVEVSVQVTEVESTRADTHARARSET